MRTAIAGAFALLLIGLVIGAYYQGRSDGFGAHEVAAQQHALQVNKQSLATEQRLHVETKDALSGLQESTETEIAAVRAAEARAKADAAAHAARAQDAEATADRAFAMVDELEGQTCPVPDPNEPCPFLCVLPDVPQ